MMEIIGRKKELGTFDKLIQSSESEFLAVYGRRRVGKTYLIREAFRSKMTFECTGLMNATKQEQILNFWITLSKLSNISTPPPNSWLEVFQHLETYLDTLKENKGKKKVVFFDEISWFDTARSGFLPAFTQFWNSYCNKRTDILLIICGSAASWIIKKVINSRGGLHNRLTQRIRLEAFDLKEMEEYLTYRGIKLTPKDIAQLYMSIGGIPYYLKQVPKGQSIPQILDSLFFANEGSLKDEYKNLYASLFKNHHLHTTVVAALAKTASGMTREQIINATKLQSGGGLTTVLSELEECGFIIKTGDFDKKEEDGLYRLMDEFTLFYFKFMSKKSEIKSSNFLYTSQTFKIWSGFAFENLCFRHHHSIAKALGFGGIHYEIYSFVDKGSAESTGAQIDLIIDRADNVINIIEAKFHLAPLVINKSMSLNIANKIEALRRKTKTKKNIFVTLITAMGVTKNEYYLSWITNDLEIGMF